MHHEVYPKSGFTQKKIGRFFSETMKQYIFEMFLKIIPASLNVFIVLFENVPSDTQNLRLRAAL